jgi:hypothetical protein
MRFTDFERRAHTVFEEIPAGYREGVDGLTVRREEVEHPDLEGIYTLGECITEEHLSGFGSADTTRSLIALYWGSFRALSLQNPDFDWDGEIWETLTHELRHHLETLAGDDSLGDVDYAADETFKRLEGRDFDPWYYQSGEEVSEGVFLVERTCYIEQRWSDAAFSVADSIRFSWAGRDYVFPRPEELGDVHFVFIRGIDAPSDQDEVEVVLLRTLRWWETVKRLFGRSTTQVLESEVDAEPDQGEG